MRLLEEPFWIGIIVVLGVLAITGVVVFIRRKCATHFDIECCQPTLKKSTVDDKMDTPCNDRRWSLQLPDGYSNFGYSSNEGTPRSKRQEDIQPNGPIINVTNTDEIDAEIKTEADVEAGYRNGYMTSGHMTRKAEEIMVEDEEEMNAYRVTEEGCLHLVDGESGVRSFPEVPVIHLHRAASARGREKQPQDRLALRRCYSSDAKLSEDSDDSAGETVKGRRASTTFPGAVTLGDGQTLNVVAYDGPVIPGYAEGEGKWVDTLKAPGRGRPDTEMDGSDSPMICHKRVNSAQRRKDFANSVRRAREITHVLLDGNNPSCHSPNSSWGSSRGCRTCGGSPFSSKDWHDSRPVVRHPSCTRSFDGVCTCVGKRHRRSRGCSVCSDASYDRSPLGSQMAGTIESGSSGYHSRHSSYQHTSHNTSHASRHSRHRRRESSEGRSASVSSSRRHSHHHHRHHHHHNQPHHLGNEPLQPRSHHSSQHSRDSNERPDSRLSIRSESRLSLGHAHRRRRHRHSRSSGSQGGGGGSDRHSPRRSGTAPDTRSVSVDYGSGDIGELHRMLSATLSNSCGRLERAEHDKLRESIRSSSSQHHDRKSRRKHDRHRHDRHRDREERRKGESRHVREHRHRERRYSRDASPPPADEESSMYKVSGYPVVPPGGHRSLSRTQSGDWQLVDGRLVMYVSGHVSGHVNGHARLAPTRSDTSTDSRLSVPETGPVRRVRSHTPLQKSKSMDIRPKEPGKGWLPGHPQLTSSLSSGSVDTPYSLSRRGSLLSRAESQLGQPRPLLLVPHQDSQLFSDPDSLGGTSSENSGSKAEHEALESSSGVSTDVHTASTSNTSRDVPGDVLPEDTEQQPNGAGWVSIPSIDLNSFLSPDSAGGLDKNSLPLHRHSQQLRAREGEEGRDGPQPQQGGEESPNKHPLRDSAYQSKEQSTEKCNSRPNSTAVSPTFSNGQEQLYARYKAALQNGPEDKRVTSQLELAAKKLTMYGIDERGTEDPEAETELGGPSESESMQVQGMDQPSISGTLSFFFHNAHCLTHSKPRRLFPTRMLSMIADEESELESPALSPHRTSHNPTPELKSPPPSPMDQPTPGTRHRPPASPTAVLELAVLDTTTSDDASDDRSEETCFSQQTEECVRVEVDLEDVTGKDSATDV